LRIAAGSGAISQSALVINPQSTLDITNNPLTITYTAGNDPVSNIRADLIAAYNGGNWAGARLTSSIARGDPAAFTLGYSDNTATDQVVVELTVPGDVNLDGQVTFQDLSIVAKDFGQSILKGDAVSWTSGDLTYAGAVTFTDLAIVAKNFGDTLTEAEQNQLPASFLAQYDLALAELGEKPITVPEPPALGLMIVALAGLLGRRQSKKARR
jgi:hypothetical protein